MYKYEVPARLHITLCDMNGNLGRINGGLGFSINEPKLIFYVEKSNTIKISYVNVEDKEQKKYIYDELKQLQEVYNLEGIKIIIEKIIPAHMGFGSKSITKLAIAKAYLELYNIEVIWTELATFLKRGGTSGISVNIIDKGGFILDGGRKKKKDAEFKPSSVQEKVEIPPILFKSNMIDIPIYLLIPDMHGIYDKKEVEFFKKVCPVSQKSVEKIARIINSEILPSICEQDIETFCDGINRIQHIGWKKHEIKLYPKKYAKFIYKLQRLGYGCGMSSTGPTIYVIGKNYEVLFNEIKKEKMQFKDIILTNINNEGIKRTEINDSYCNR